MIRTTAVPRPVRAGVAAASVVGIVALAGCAADASAETTDTSTSASTSSSSSATDTSTSASASATDSSTDSSTDTTSTSTYTDGTYTADGTYIDGGGTSETISVTITLEDDIVTAVEVTGDAASPQSQQYQTAFIGGIADVVVGQDIDTLSVSRVAGSSLTSGGFNNALETIKSEALA
ncbi:MAG: hypothetical protein ABS62_09945 [Microbacterium sp. SCN 70-200]|uniref:hypothetical protein n=1 Tax=unclassified Microbacterium TaxID=2609290 RepID=UPI00086EB29B|nr:MULTISPECIES: hypothetical protein [unclassified Microbacterium]MBN9213399.1 hypothetical protein [Microbacterium sp.]ODT40493.1 MAG: hypothetical protein ABS62_09945 [Microbacterium sp. SCN 70-200]OJV85037.1 MAG: hypothetical protein BGO46_10635 [Microbacterium sp. 70-16]